MGGLRGVGQSKEREMPLRIGDVCKVCGNVMTEATVTKHVKLNRPGKPIYLECCFCKREYDRKRYKRRKRQLARRK